MIRSNIRKTISFLVALSTLSAGLISCATNQADSNAGDMVIKPTENVVDSTTNEASSTVAPATAEPTVIPLVPEKGESVIACKGSWFVIDNKDQLWGWGSNEHGQLGVDRSIDNVESPTLIMKEVASFVYCPWDSSSEYYALKNNGEVWRWGNIRRSGNNETELDRPEHFMDDVISLKVRVDSWFAIKNDGSLWAWGLNDYHQLGTGVDGGVKSEPLRVLDDVKSVHLGGGAFAIRKDDSLWSWGPNGYGITGTGSTDEIVRTPKHVMDDVESIIVGNDCVFAIQKNGDLYSWGNNEYGQLGDGTTINKTMPQHITDKVKSVVLETRGYYTTSCAFATKKDNTLYRWGAGYGLTPQKIKSEIDSIISISRHYWEMLSKKTDQSLWLCNDEDEKKLLDDVNQYGLLNSDTVYALINDGKLFAYWDWNEDGIEIANDVLYVCVTNIADNGTIELHAVMNNGSLWLFSENGAEQKLFDGVRLP